MADDKHFLNEEMETRKPWIKNPRWRIILPFGFIIAFIMLGAIWYLM